MARNDERSIRASYYERVGFKGMKEKTLDNLLNEDPRSVEKLQQFCLRFSVPSIMRLEVWKVIYEFSSTHSRNSTEILWWKEIPYYHIKSMQKKMHKITKNMSLPEEMAVQFLVRQGWIKFDVPSQLKETSSLEFIAIATSMVKITESSEVAAYYLSQELYRFLHSHPDRLLEDLETSFNKKLNATQPKLHAHCTRIDLIRNLPLRTWMLRAFAGILEEESLVSLWDKVVGGSMKVLVYVALSIIEHLNSLIQLSNDWREALRLFSFLSSQDSSHIVKKALDQWIKDGYQLFPVEHGSRVNTSNNKENGASSLSGKAQKIISSSLPLTQLVNEIKIESRTSIFSPEELSD